MLCDACQCQAEWLSDLVNAMIDWVGLVGGCIDRIELAKNRLSTIPQGVMDARKLPKLRDLKLGEQRDGLLSELPDEVGLLRVSKLDLQGNALQALPESFYAIHTLETVNLCARPPLTARPLH